MQNEREQSYESSIPMAPVWFLLISGLIYSWSFAGKLPGSRVDSHDQFENSHNQQ